MPEPSLARLFREYGSRWDIEQIPPGTKWVAVEREPGNEYIRLVFAHEVGSLRYRLSQAEQEVPEEREPRY